MQKAGFCRFGGPEVDTLHEAAANEASDWLHWSVLKQLPLFNDIYYFKILGWSTSLRGANPTWKDFSNFPNTFETFETNSKQIPNFRNTFETHSYFRNTFETNS